MTSPLVPDAEPPNPRASQQVVVGRIVGVHGYDGTLRVAPESSNPDRFRQGDRIMVAGASYTVQRTAEAPPLLLLKLDGISSEEAARDLTGAQLTVPAEAVPPLPEGSYYHFQLIGLNVVRSDGSALGTIQEVLETGANDVYVVVQEGAELLVPAIDDVVVDVDLVAGAMIVDLPEGLEPRHLASETGTSPRPRRRRRRAPRPPKTQANTQSTG